MKSGDKIKFGKKWCEEMGEEHLLGKTIMLTPQIFEYDNGLYSEEQECPGIYNKEAQESDSIYHLFGNNLESFYDCELIPATEEDLKMIEEQKGNEEEEIARQYGDMAEYFQENS